MAKSYSKNQSLGNTVTADEYKKLLSKKKSKYGNNKTVFNGIKFDSEFEADQAKELELKKRAKLILDYDCQFKVEAWAYDKFGKPFKKKSHKVDFRIHNLDGSFTLLEAKGLETADYKERREWLLKLWLPEHPNYTYEVVYLKTRKHKGRYFSYTSIVKFI